MNINQINALRKIASAYETAYILEKEAAFNPAAIKNAITGAGKAIGGAAKRTTTAFKNGGLKGGMTSLKRQGAKAGKAVANQWNKLSPGAQAGVAAGAGALGGIALSRAAGTGDEDQMQQ